MKAGEFGTKVWQIFERKEIVKTGWSLVGLAALILAAEYVDMKPNAKFDPSNTAQIIERHKSSPGHYYGFLLAQCGFPAGETETGDGCVYEEWPVRPTDFRRPFSHDQVIPDNLPRTSKIK